MCFRMLIIKGMQDKDSTQSECLSSLTVKKLKSQFYTIIVYQEWAPLFYHLNAMTFCFGLLLACLDFSYYMYLLIELCLCM